MKKILALTVVFLMGIASVSIMSSGEPVCEDTPPSGCQACMTNWCESSCYEPGTDSSSPCGDFCSIRSFFDCQKRWFNPYWMEIYDGNVKGCYARDLLCINRLNLPEVYPDECRNICGEDIDCQFECGCYLYGKPSTGYYPPNFPTITQDPIPGQNPPLIINIPSCSDSRAFFQSPPPCAGEGDAREYDGKLINSCCFDMRGCGNNPSLECAVPCSGYNMPANYKCDVNEYVIMEIFNNENFTINGVTYCNQVIDPSNLQLDGLPKGIGLLGDLGFNGSTCPDIIVWYNGDRPFDPTPGVIMIPGVPRTITIEGGYLEFSLEQKCCYDCKPKPSLPATILYPKVDIETFSVPGGATVIQDGKILSSFEMSPGSQQVFLQVENRGFFTQNDTRLRFDGLPEGVTVQTVPETQKLKAHNIGTYSALFTLGSNVPSGTYKVTMVAYSPSGVFDTATIDFVVP